MDTRSLVLEMTRMLTDLQLIPALDRFYDKDIEVSARGPEEQIRSGKSAGLGSVYNWFMNSLLHHVRVEFLAIDGDKAAIELLLDVTPSGQERRLERLVMLQEWKDGKIIRMTNYSKRVAG
jgi:hypothetical protein